jgi:hypothetical protein
MIPLMDWLYRKISTDRVSPSTKISNTEASLIGMLYEKSQTLVLVMIAQAWQFCDHLETMRASCHSLEKESS